jgi:hypothetical protein
MTANLLLSYLSAGCVSWEAFPGLGLNGTEIVSVAWQKNRKVFISKSAVL